MSQQIITAKELEKLKYLHFNTFSKASHLITLSPKTAIEVYNDYVIALGTKYGFDPKKCSIDHATREVILLPRDRWVQ